eukprot:m.446507 g.446507  ORF g.446507 m.446507 type:complete len:791 (+) comp19377_c0_seq1:53-2425(+)
MDLVPEEAEAEAPMASPSPARKGLKQYLPKVVGWLAKGVKHKGKGKGKRRGSEDLGSHNPPLNKTMIGAPTNFQVVGHLSVGDQEGRLKGFGIGLTHGMMLGDEVVGLVGILGHHHKHHKGPSVFQRKPTGAVGPSRLSRMRTSQSRITSGSSMDDWRGMKEYEEVDYSATCIVEVEEEEAGAAATDRIGVQDGTYRHSWPSRGVVVSRLAGGRAEPDDGDGGPSDSVFTLKDFVVGRVLGEGFFGRVYVAEHAKTRQKVVIKELKESGHEAQVAFIHEVAILKAISHPNLLHYLGLFVKDEMLNMVTEFVEGGTLQDAVDGKRECYRELSWTYRVSMATDIAAGLAYLHARRLIHRDLKPENCLIRSPETMSIVVCDFGLCRILEGEVLRDGDRSVPPSPAKSPLSPNSPGSPSEKPRRGFRERAKSSRLAPQIADTGAIPQRMSVVGTVDYMAPEVAFSMEYNESADVFSYGLILACGLIARAKDADADEFRGADFALEEKRFRRNYRHGVPPAFLNLTCECSVANAGARPSFVQILARLRLVELRLPIDLGKLAEMPEEAEVDESEETQQKLTAAHRDFVFILLAEIGVDSTETSRAVIEETAKAAKLKKPYWLLNDPEYQLEDNMYRIPFAEKPKSTIPKHEAFLDSIAAKFGGIAELHKDVLVEFASECGLKKPYWLLNDPNYQLEAEGMYRVPDDGLQAWRRRLYPKSSVSPAQSTLTAPDNLSPITEEGEASADDTVQSKETEPGSGTSSPTNAEPSGSPLEVGSPRPKIRFPAPPPAVPTLQ